MADTEASRDHSAMLANPLFDADLLHRYDRPGPRYTSYPTAPQFTFDFDESALRKVVRESNDDPIPRSLSIYVHVPFCASPCFYCGCNRIITRDRSLRGRLRCAPRPRDLDDGGDVRSRSRRRPAPFRRRHAQFPVGATVARRRRPRCATISISPTADDSDMSIELDPRYLSPSDIADLATIGFNRASLGVQDFDPAVQAAVNRVQTVEETLAIIEACRRYGLRSVNVDLIYGLPKQTPEGFAKTLDTVIAARPDRLAVYSYAHLPQLFKPQRHIDAADLPAAGREARAVATGDRKAHDSRLRLHRHGPFRACRTTTSRWRRHAAACIATSWATRRTPTATSWASG